MEYKGHKNLIIWQKAMDLVEDISKITSAFLKK
jgi:hypothetical protein